MIILSQKSCFCTVGCAKMLSYKNQQMIVHYSFGLAFSGNPEIEEIPTGEHAALADSATISFLQTPRVTKLVMKHVSCISEGIWSCPLNFS